MLNDNDRGEAVARFTSAVATIAAELLTAGAPAEALAAALRMRAAAIEVGLPRTKGMTPNEAELVDLARTGHEFINTLQVAGIAEPVVVTVLGNVLVERVARVRGAAGAADWLRRLAALVDANAEAIEVTAQSH